MVGVTFMLTPAFTLARQVVVRIDEIKELVIQRIDPDYENYRAAMIATDQLYMPQRYPDAIVLVETVSDVIEAVKYARDNDLKIVTRSTGHTHAQTCLRNGGLLLDLSRLYNIEIDPESATAWVEPGARSGSLISAAAPYDLAFPAAHGAAVGLGGYLLGGGIGWNSQKWGIACRSVIAADIVLADGTLVSASETEHPDLLWAVRGAGPGFFGVVVRLQIKLYPLPKVITASYYTFSEDRFEDLADTLAELIPSKDPSVEALASLNFNEVYSPLPAQFSGGGIHCQVDLYAFTNSEKQNRELLEPFSSNSVFQNAGVRNENQLRTFQELYLFRNTQTGGTGRARVPHTNTDNMWTDRPRDAFLAYADLLKEATSPNSRVQMSWGMNVAAVNANTSFPSLTDYYMYMSLTGKDGDEAYANKLWMEKSNLLVQKLAKGHYINEAEYELFPERIPGCFSDAGWKRMANLRDKYDPLGVFHNYLGH